MYKLVVIYTVGFEIIPFKEMTNCRHRYDQLRAEPPKRGGNQVVALFIYNKYDYLVET